MASWTREDLFIFMSMTTIVNTNVLNLITICALKKSGKAHINGRTCQVYKAVQKYSHT